MAMHHVCDGNCGFSSPNPDDFEEHGLVVKRQYCKTCAEHVRSYLADRDAAHTAAALAYQEAHGAARQTLVERGFAVPDHHE